MAIHALERAQWRYRWPTLRAQHDIMVAALTRMAVPVEPCSYDTAGESAGMIEDRVEYLRKLFELMRPISEKIANDAADYAGARVEGHDYDYVLDGFEDFLAPITAAGEQLGEGQ